MSKLLLVRHGQSEWNATGRWQGIADPPLTDLGVHQAETAARSLGMFDLIASSNLQRANRTAEIIASAIGVGPVLVEPELRERDAGEWQGLTKDEIEAQWPGYLADNRWPPGYEGDDSVSERAISALARLSAQLAGGTGLVVVHAGVIYNVEALAGMPFERMPNLGGRWIELSPEKIEAGERVLLIDPDSVEALAAATIERFGAVHVVCNNAGVGGGGLIKDQQLVDWKWVIDVNLWGVIHGVHSFLPHLRSVDEAHIMSTASVAGLTSGPGLGPYNASKYAVVAIMETLHHEMERDDESNVGVSVLCPGVVNTTLTNPADEPRPDWLMPETVAEAILHAVTAPMNTNIFDITLIPTEQSPW